MHNWYCLLVYKENSESKDRLEILEKTDDGFLLSEEDLKIRGPGDFFGYRQSGDLKFKRASIVDDLKILEVAKEDALEKYRDTGYYWIEDKFENAVAGQNVGMRPILIEHGWNMNEVVPNGMKKVTIDSVYAQAREVLKEGRVDEARDLADYGIVMAAEAQEEGLTMDDELEGVRIGLWLERFWYFLENNNLLLA